MLFQGLVRWCKSVTFRGFSFKKAFSVFFFFGIGVKMSTGLFILLVVPDVDNHRLCEVHLEFF